MGKKSPSAPDPAPPPRLPGGAPNLDFLKDANAFVKRFLLAEALGPPKALQRRRRPGSG